LQRIFRPKKEEVVKGHGSVSIPPFGISFDASYDARLDTLVPGYKVINVLVENTSFNILGFDPKKDQWSIVMAGSKKAIPAIHNLRSQQPKIWSALPDRIREIVGYPLVLPIGGKEVIDIFVPDKYDLSAFNEIRVSIYSLQTRFDILVTQ
jgi:hypothetical protein